MKITYIFGLLLLPLLYSCSTLKVNVSTANPDELKKIADKIDPSEKNAYQYRRALIPLFNSEVVTNPKSTLAAFDKIIDRLSETPELDKTTAVKIKQNFKINYNKRLEDIQSDYANTNKLMEKKAYGEVVPIYLNLGEKFTKLLADLTVDSVLKPSESAPLMELSTKIIIANATFVGGRANLLGDRVVAYITMKEHEDIWKSTYNKTVSRTAFGNADIAVVLNEMPDSYNNNYSIKGVRVDAAKLIQSTFDVMTQAINVAASMSGIRPTSPGDNNSFYPEEFTQIQTLPVKTAELNNRKKLLEDVQQQMLLKILAEDLQRKKGDALKESSGRIINFWETYKTNLEPTKP